MARFRLGGTTSRVTIGKWASGEAFIMLMPSVTEGSNDYRTFTINNDGVHWYNEATQSFTWHMYHDSPRNEPGISDWARTKEIRIIEGSPRKLQLLSGTGSKYTVTLTAVS